MIYSIRFHSSLVLLAWCCCRVIISSFRGEELRREHREMQHRDHGEKNWDYWLK